jgi:hypothetical protein
VQARHAVAKSPSLLITERVLMKRGLLVKNVDNGVEMVFTSTMNSFEGRGSP